ncbi:recombination regulator RecX, partial [bacterium]|nr:recombination regulator RecX [bacterium]
MENNTHQKCYAHAIKLLGRREYHSKKLIKKLSDFGFEEDAIFSSLEALTQKNYLNDQRYKALKIKYYLERQKGPRYILSKLREDGVNADLSEIEEVMSENEFSLEDSAKKLIVQKLEKLSREENPQKKLQKTFNYLRQKG